MTCLNPEGGGGTLVYLYYMSNIEAWPIFFLADLQKWMVVQRGSTDIFGLRANFGGGQGQALLV